MHLMNILDSSLFAYPSYWLNVEQDTTEDTIVRPLSETVLVFQSALVLSTF